MMTRNITVKVDAETYRKARMRAAQRGTSVSAMVRDFLTAQEEESTDPQAQRIAALEKLYKVAEKRAKRSSRKLKPLSRDEIYAERLR